MKTSVILTVFNGRKFLIAQLDSIRRQTVQPDEVLIADDGSSDGSADLIRAYIERHKPANWVFMVNSKNLGYVENFLQLAEKASGDILIFCDQDDVWKDHKVEKITSVYQRSESVKAVSSGYTVIDEFGQVSGNTLFTRSRAPASGVREVSFQNQLRSNYSVGFSLSVRRAFYLNLIPVIRQNNLTFDVPVGVFAALVKGYSIIGESLVFRRVHSGNVSGPMYSLSARLKQADRHIEGRMSRIRLWEAVNSVMVNRLSPFSETSVEPPPLSALKASLKALQERSIYQLMRLFFDSNFRKYHLLILVDLLVILFGTYANGRCRK